MVRKLICGLFIVGVSGCVSRPVLLDSEPQEKPILYYSFEHDLVNGQVVDCSGNGFTGRAEACVWTPDGVQNGGALTFNSKASVLQVVPNLDVPSWNAYTVSIWFKRDDGDYFNHGYGCKILDKTSWGQDWHLHVYAPKGKICPGALGWSIYDASIDHSTAAMDTALNYGDNQWHHVVLLRDGKRGEFWVDGKRQQIIFDMIPVHSTAPLCIGSSLGPDANQRTPWSGQLDEVRIYNRSISYAEIKKLFNKPPPQLRPRPLDVKQDTQSQTNSKVQQ